MAGHRRPGPVGAALPGSAVGGMARSNAAALGPSRGAAADPCLKQERSLLKIVPIKALNLANGMQHGCSQRIDRISQLPAQAEAEQAP